MTDLFPPPHANLNGHGAIAPMPLGPPRPPKTVRVVVWCLYAIVALMALNIVSAIWDLATWDGYVDRVASSLHVTAATVASEKSGNTSADTVGIVLFAVMAILYALAAVYVRRGVRAGQILAFVGVPLLLLCGIGSFVPVSATALEKAAQHQQPALMTVVSAIAELPLVPLILAVAALLLTRSARMFFRRMPPAPPGYMYIPAPPQAPTSNPQWQYPIYGGLPPAAPFIYPPPDASPPSGFPSLPPSAQTPPTPPQASEEAPPGNPQDEPK